jgi:DNA-binding transcriptional regulator YhcF (GntR family)
MSSIPQKQNLPDLVLNWLRQEIENGNFKEKLPSERILCDRLQVSRPTLRIAINQLKKEGWLEVINKRTTVRRRPIKSAQIPNSLTRRTITFLSPVGLEEMTWMGLVLYSELGRHLAEVGTSVRHISKPGLGHGKIGHHLDRLIQDNPTDAWVLYRADVQTQKYFQENAIPTFLFGNAHAGIDLPALSIDYSAALRHCLGSLRRLKHDQTRVLLVLPDTRLAGEQQLTETFLKIYGKSAQRQILFYQESTEDIPQLLKELLQSKHQPTALITVRTRAALSIHGLITNNCGLKIPQDISLICLEDAPFMRYLVPEVSRYHVKSAHVTKFVSSVLMQLLSSGISTPWGRRPFVPKFIKGQSLGKARRTP